MNCKRLIPVIIFCLYLAAVAFLCFSRPDALPQMSAEWFGLPADKVAHFVMFCPYPILAYKLFDMKGMSSARRLSVLLLIMITGVGLAMGSERIQATLSYRDADISDFYADGLGLAAGGFSILTYTVLRKER